MVWICAALILGVSLFALLRAMRRPVRHAPADGNADVSFYHSQIAEIRRQAEAGLLGAEEEQAATAEAGRRLMAAKSKQADGSAADAWEIRRRRIASIAILVLAPAIALPVYAALGSPDVPDLALASREKPRAPDPAEQQIASLVSQIEQRLTQNPNDVRGLGLVAPLYLRLGRAADAVEALTRLIEIAGPTPDRQADLGEALVARSNGLVTPEAKAAFEAAVAAEPQLQKAQFYLGRAAAQSGDAARARSIFVALLAEVPAGPIHALIENEIAGLSNQAAPAGRAP